MDKGWVAAGDLESGDEVYLIDGDTAVVTGCELEKLGEAIKVYNLEVEGYNTYFVGDDGVLVHNYPGNGTGEGAGQVKDSEGSTNLKVISDPSRLLETTANPQDHHIIPAFRGKSKLYADFIKNLGIDVDQYTITVSGGKGGMHMSFIHGKGKWNQKWMNYIDSNPYATAKDIYQFAGKMMDDYGLSGLQIHPYGK